MLFPTFTFAAFFAVVLPVAWALRRRPVPWKVFVLGASYWFYAAWDRRFVLLLVAMTLANAAAARVGVRTRSQTVHRSALAVAVAFDLGVLAVFKYYGFFTQSLETNLGISSPALSIVLPIGVSFFTFQAISYVVDVHRGDAEAAPLLDFAVYLSFFPQLVAGPIVRATEFLPQMRFPPAERRQAGGPGSDAEPGPIPLRTRITARRHQTDEHGDDAEPGPIPLRTRITARRRQTDGPGGDAEPGPIPLRSRITAWWHQTDGRGGDAEPQGPSQLMLWKEPAARPRPSGPVDRVEFGRAVQLIGRGMFKKVVVADFLASAIVDEAFASPGAYGALDVLFGVYGYAVQIYADFSGYTDMAIGVALLMGFRFPQNFDRPYAAVSVQDFWRRWHMTLSRWLRDYLYIPLGGNRRGPVRTYVNLLVTMGLGGLWHGAAGVFIVWGLYQGAGLAAERLAAELRTKRNGGPGRAGSARRAPRHPGVGSGRRAPRHPGVGSALGTWLRVALVFHFVCAGWVLFNSESLALAGDVYGRLVQGWGTAPELLTPMVLAVIVGSVLLQYVPLSLSRRWTTMLATAPASLTAVGLAVWTMIVVALGPEGVADYIYFQF